MTEPKRKYFDPMDDVLDRPIAFNPAYKRITHSTVAALMLSQAWYWTKRLPIEADGWFYKTQEEWEEETGLTRSEQETARKHLKELKLQEEELRGIPARLYYRVNKEQVYKLLGIKFAETLQTGMLEDDKQDGGIVSNINKESETTTENTTETTTTAEIFKFYEYEIGLITPTIAGEINAFLDDPKCPPEWIIEAFRECALQNKRNWSYARAILRRWMTEGKQGKVKLPQGVRNPKPANSFLEQLERA